MTSKEIKKEIRKIADKLARLETKLILAEAKEQEYKLYTCPACGRKSAICYDFDKLKRYLECIHPKCGHFDGVDREGEYE